MSQPTRSASADAPLGLPAAPAASRRTAYLVDQGAGVTRQDVVRWSQSGTRDDVIIDRIRHGGSTFHLDAAAETDLLDRGVSPSVVREMKDTLRK